MATQRYISTSFWDDPWIVSLEPMEQFLYLYFLTNPLTNIAGVYQISMRRIVNDTKLTEEQVRNIITKFEAAGKAFYFEEEFIVLPKWPKHQKWENHSKINAGIKACLEKLDADLFEFLIYIGYCYPMDSLSKPIDRVSKPMDRLSKARNYSDSDIDIDLDINTNTDARAAQELPAHFIKLWQSNADVFNCLARLKKPKDWEAFWKQNTMSLEQINLAVKNFIDAVHTGAMERRFIPGSPDAFVLNGWLTRSQTPFKKQGQHISNDNVSEDDVNKYFRRIKCQTQL